MIREYELKNLGCANCAAKIEAAVKGLDGVKDASVSFATSTLKVWFDEGYTGDAGALMERTVHKFEPDVVVMDRGVKNGAKESKSEDGNSHDHEHEEGHLKTIVVGAVVFVVGLVLPRFVEIGSWGQLGIFLLSYFILGWEVLFRAAKNIVRGQVFDENFLMSVATIGAFLIGEYPEAVAVMLFYQVGEYFQAMAVRKSRRSIADLMDIRPDFANLKKGDQILRVSPEEVGVGDVIVVRPGEKIPLDGVILEGNSSLDTRALTGESVPRNVYPSDAVLSGCVNQTGLLTVEVTKVFGESTVAKIIDLVENASSKKAPTENFITTFSRYYTPVVVGLAVLISVIPPLFAGGMWSQWVNRGLIFLVISCPCALVISIPLGFFGGIGGASRKGILVKGSNYLEALSKLDVVVFDKTGTLTKGIFEVTAVEPFGGFSKGDLLEVAARAEAFSTHPIALSIRRAYGKVVGQDGMSDYREIPGHGVSVVMDGKRVLAGNSKLMKSEGVRFTDSLDVGTKVFVAVDGVFAGYIVISDEIKPDSAKAVAMLKERGVRKTVMLTGDNAEIADAIAKKLRLDEVYSGLLPDQKVQKLEELEKQKAPGGKLAFVGDGINDAPVLARADVGIAMGGLGSDAAIEAADVVLMTDEPSKLAVAVDIARGTKRIVWQNIVFALGVKAVFLLMGAFGVATMWEAVFADVGVSVLAILNSMRAMRIK